MNVHSLHIETNIEHHPKDAIRMRARLIEHVMITFLLQLRQAYPKAFGGTQAVELMDYILKKNKDQKINDQYEQIIDLLYENYPDLSYFHNHYRKSGSPIIRYPLVQYRSKGGRLHINAFNEAIPIVEHWLNKARWDSWLSHKHVKYKEEKHDKIQLRSTPKYYRLMDWIALNRDMYQRWQTDVLWVNRSLLLEEALVAQLQFLCKQFGAQDIAEQIKTNLVLMREIRDEKIYGHRTMVFNVLFRSNIDLPRRLAIGKATSIGFGSQQLTRWQGEVSELKHENVTVTELLESL